jgi:RNA polymerase sigma-70 factor (ECF subfamily)
MHSTDAVLIEKCINGQKDAFAEIIQRYQHRIYFMALTRMRDPFEAEDLAQETFIQAYCKLASYDPTRSFRNWLFTICANLGKNRLRSRARRREVHNPSPEVKPNQSKGPEHCRIDLMAALHKIPEKLRVPLFLKHVEGFSYTEISMMMNIGTSAAKMRVKRGRDQLVLHLSEQKTETTPKSKQTGNAPS